MLQSSLECAPGNGKHVLYWMRTALRGHENPALDVARAVANQQGLPLVVAAFVLRSHTYPTARRYQFWLQGFCDTQLELREQVSHPPAHDLPLLKRQKTGISLEHKQGLWYPQHSVFAHPSRPCVV